MTLQRLLPNTFGMLYHASLYDRMVAFAKENTPEFPCEPVIRKWLERFYAGDDTLHILVKINDNGVLVGHALIDIQEAYGERVVFCHQVAQDKGTLSQSEFIASTNEGVEYVDKIREQSGAVCSVMTVSKNANMYAKKYGYRIARTVLIKVSEHNGTG